MREGNSGLAICFLGDQRALWALLRHSLNLGILLGVLFFLFCLWNRSKIYFNFIFVRIFTLRMITPLGLYWTQHRTRKQSKGKHHVLNVLSCPVSSPWFSGTASPPSQKPRDVTGAQVVNKVLTWDADTLLPWGSQGGGRWQAGCACSHRRTLDLTLCT